MRQRDGIVRLVQPYLRLHEFPLFGRSVLVKYNVFLHRYSLFVLLLPSYEPKVFWDDTTCFASTICMGSASSGVWVHGLADC